jgi:hypothetical protein
MKLRVVIGVLLASTVVFSLPAVTLSAADSESDSQIFTPDKVVDKGIAALLRLQQPNGSFDAGAGITSLCGMALLAGGHTPTRGAYQVASKKTLDFVLSFQDKISGYLGADQGNMYSHGFATLYLAECYGMSPEPSLRRSLEAAIDLIHRSQNSEGGWRYSPAPVDADISVTICQVMALRAAFNIGIGGDPSQKSITRAITYVRRCANGDGSFNYTAGMGGGGGGGEGSTGIPRAAAGAMSLIGSGITDLSDPALGPAMRFLRKHVAGHLKDASMFLWYGQYYAAQALFHSPDENDWDLYWSKAAPIIAQMQDADGLWSRSDGFGAAYGTAMALIILQIPNNYLPIFQR